MVSPLYLLYLVKKSLVFKLHSSLTSVTMNTGKAEPNISDWSAKQCSGPAEIATAGPVENANYGSTEKATTRILSYPLY